jgi:hypothetical protein
MAVETLAAMRPGLWSRMLAVIRHVRVTTPSDLTKAYRAYGDALGHPLTGKDTQ